MIDLRLGQIFPERNTSICFQLDSLANQAHAGYILFNLSKQNLLGLHHWAILLLEHDLSKPSFSDAVGKEIATKHVNTECYARHPCLDLCNRCMLDYCREGGLMMNWINYYSPTTTWLENGPWMSWRRFDVDCISQSNNGYFPTLPCLSPLKTNPLRRQFPANIKQSLGGATKFATKPMEFQAKTK